MKNTLQRMAILALLISFLLIGSRLDACTTFCLEGKDGLVFGRNYDWGFGVGIVVVNKRCLSKTAFVNSRDEPAKWVSRYGSITFNQYGRELPMGGINEAGLVVEQMLLSDTRYPDQDERPVLRELAWTQYQLDTCASVDDVIESDAKVRILQGSAPLHFLVCDRSGRKAVIEFLEGKMTVHRAEKMPVAALANSPYAESLDYLKQFQGFGGEKMIPESARSLDRFARAAQAVRLYKAGQRDDQERNIVEHAFRILEDVSHGPATQWSTVYDLKGLTVRFRTATSPHIKTLALKDFDFSCETPCRVLDIDTKEPGDAVRRFTDYTTEINRKLVFEAWKKTPFLKDTPDEVLDLLAESPKSIVCGKVESARD